MLRDLLQVLWEVPEGGSGAAPEPVPGTGDDGPGGEPAGDAATGDTGEGGRTPESVPYARFKEVNDRRKQAEELAGQYGELSQLGYGPEDLLRLARWELEYVQDPAGTWLAQATTLELPEPIKEAIAKEIGQAPPPAGERSTPASTDAMPDDPPEWAKPLLEDHVERQKEKESMRAQAERAASQQLLDSLLSAWRAIDEKEGLKTPEATMLAHVVSASHRCETPQEVLALARTEWLESLEEVRRVDHTPPPRGPRPVPSSGSGAAPVNAEKPPTTLTEAGRRAKAMLSSGETPVE